MAPEMTGPLNVAVADITAARTVNRSDALSGNAPLLGALLGERLNRRGWQFKVSGTNVLAHRPEWPAQLRVLAREAEGDGPAILGLSVELVSMPLRGERFRDVFNNDRELLLREYGSFTLRQMSFDGAWLKPVSGQTFINGVTDGVSRKARMVVFDRKEDDSPSLVTRFAADSNRFIDCGSEFARMLQRLYQRTVLSVAAEDAGLPDLVRPSLAAMLIPAEADSAYPWRP
jgi:hypothetical protein